jgi:hypothetical protein
MSVKSPVFLRRWIRWDYDKEWKGKKLEEAVVAYSIIFLGSVTDTEQNHTKHSQEAAVPLRLEL